MNVNYDDERFTNLEQEKKSELNKYNQTYDNLIAERDKFTEQQQNYVDSWVNSQNQIANDNLQHQIDLYNQQKEQVEKDYQKEASASYSDYLKEVDRYGVSRENVVANGLSNSGYAESSKVNMYNTYQNRIATARSSLNNALLDFNNAIKEAQLSNNAIIAQNALTALQQKLDIALEGFNYKDTATQNKLTWENNINNQYYNRYQDVEDQINYENQQAEAIRQYNEQMAYQKEQDALEQQRWERELALQQQRWEQELAYQKQQDAIANAQRWASVNSSSSNSYYAPSLEDGNMTNSNNGVDEYGNNNNIQSKSDYIFSTSKEGQPSYINNTKLKSVGKMGSTFANIPATIKSGQNIWTDGNKYYVWEKTSDNSGRYIDITEQYNYAKSGKIGPVYWGGF